MDNLGQAVLIMILGMGGVFSFLAVQALITVALSRLAPHHEADDDAPHVPSMLEVAPVTASPIAGADSLVPTVAIIQAAITAYESDQGVR